MNKHRHHHEHNENIVLVSTTWKTMCGIAIYTEDLLKELINMDGQKYKDKFSVKNIDGKHSIKGRLIHLQHEFGILPKPPKVKGNVMITFHTITNDIDKTLRKFESHLNVVAYTIPCPGALEYMVGKTGKDVYIIPLGSKLMNNSITKEEARMRLGIPTNGLGGDGKPIAFVFGFQSANKNYKRLEEAAKNTGIHLLISGSIHSSGYKSKLSNNENITILGRHLSNEEIDLYALASDLLLFDYKDQHHYSSSAALHRTVGAGRPVICVRTRHFNDIEEGKDCLKFEDVSELQDKIKHALDRKIDLGNMALDYARRTSWNVIARQHINIYTKFGGLIN